MFYRAYGIVLVQHWINAECAYGSVYQIGQEQHDG